MSDNRMRTVNDWEESFGFDFDTVVLPKLIKKGYVIEDRHILSKLTRKGYIWKNYRVNLNFQGLDSEFKAWFPEYTNDQFSHLESILQAGGKSGAHEWIESILIALVLAVFIRTYFVQPFKIPSGSMRMTLIEGDHLFVSKLRCKLPHGAVRYPRFRDALRRFRERPRPLPCIERLGK